MCSDSNSKVSRKQKKMKRFCDLFLYEDVSFVSGTYNNVRLLQDIIVDGHAYAYANEVFPTVHFDTSTYEIHFFEEFDKYSPIFTVLFKKPS